MTVPFDHYDTSVSMFCLGPLGAWAHRQYCRVTQNLSCCRERQYGLTFVVSNPMLSGCNEQIAQVGRSRGIRQQRADSENFLKRAQRGGMGVVDGILVAARAKGDSRIRPTGPSLPPEPSSQVIRMAPAF